MACYAFKGGPFHDLLVKFGYDPRLSIEGRQYVFSRSHSSVLCWARFPYQHLHFVSIVVGINDFSSATRISKEQSGAGGEGLAMIVPLHLRES
jgi:hypothetical protein